MRPQHTPFGEQKVVLEGNIKELVADDKRCLQCDLRLTVGPVKFWGSY